MNVEIVLRELIKDFEEKLKRELLPKEVDFLKDILSNERDDETSS
ncbi:hypothetical protein [Fictibacillus sp. WQ 8-8]|nr:hypothetical protein [Fictibacillus sp. WQ 8-8]SFE39680.1 hypothetical protein SAMN05428981_105178 [Bacillus sp. OV194]